MGQQHIIQPESPIFSFPFLLPLLPAPLSVLLSLFPSPVFCCRGSSQFLYLYSKPRLLYPAWAALSRALFQVIKRTLPRTGFLFPLFISNCSPTELDSQPWAFIPHSYLYQEQYSWPHPLLFRALTLYHTSLKPSPLGHRTFLLQLSPTAVHCWLSCRKTFPGLHPWTAPAPGQSPHPLRALSSCLEGRHHYQSGLLTKISWNTNQKMCATLRSSKGFPNIWALSQEAPKNIKEFEDEHVSSLYDIILSLQSPWELWRTGNSKGTHKSTSHMRQAPEVPHKSTSHVRQAPEVPLVTKSLSHRSKDGPSALQEPRDSLSLEHSVPGLGTYSLSESAHKSAF